MRNRQSCLLWSFILLANSVTAPASVAKVGPPNGYLLLVGGGMRDPGILGHFMKLAGGSEAPIVVIPTAGGQDYYDEYWPGLEPFREAGARNLIVLHTVDRSVADTEEFVRPILGARGVFFTGGRQWRLADSYLNTRTHRELQALLDRGGIIGGTSAGATIMGSFLVRGDTKGNTTMVGDHVEGFGFLQGVAIDQHMLKRNRHFDMIEVIRERPELLGIGLDENAAILVSQDVFTVMGQSYVAIYDVQRSIPPDGKFYFLAPGDVYNLETREAFRPGVTPLQRIKEAKWK